MFVVKNAAGLYLATKHPLTGIDVICVWANRIDAEYMVDILRTPHTFEVVPVTL
mgnify:CR=1 FL=1